MTPRPAHDTDCRVTTGPAARLLGVTRGALTTPAMDAILRPIRVGRIRIYRIDRLLAYAAQRDAAKAARLERLARIRAARAALATDREVA